MSSSRTHQQQRLMKMSQQLTVLIVQYENLGSSELLKADFETVVTEAIDEVFLSFGKPVGAAIFKMLEQNYGMRKEDIPGKPEVFANAIESTFGDTAKLIEMEIIRSLHAQIKGFSYKTKRRDFFITYLRALRVYLNVNVTG